MSLIGRQSPALTRDSIQSSVDSVKNTFSSWDSCMSKTYCKWPVIVGIIIGSLILLSVLACLAKIVFCGAECCFCCAGCFKCLCCGGGSRRKDDGYNQRMKNGGYARPPDNPGFNYGPQGQYRSQAPPQYGPSTATFEAPSKGGNVNADALPHMPSWSDATSRRVEDNSAPEEDVELGKLNPAGQAEPMLPKFESDDYAIQGDSPHGMKDITGDLGLGAGAMAANPYHDNYAGASTPVSQPRRTSQQYGQLQTSPERRTSYGQAQTSPIRQSSQQYGQPPLSHSRQSSQQYGQAQTSPTRQTSQQYGQAPASSAYGAAQNPPHRVVSPQQHQPYGQASPYEYPTQYNRTSPPSYTTDIHPSQRPQQPRLQSPTSYGAQQSYPAQSNSPTYSRPSQSPTYANPTSPTYAPAPAPYRPPQQQPADPGQQGYRAPPYGGPETTRKPPSGSWRDV